MPTTDRLKLWRETVRSEVKNGTYEQMPNHDLAKWQDENEERLTQAAEAHSNRCAIHPHYTGDTKPDGVCSRCLLVWVTRKAEQYSRTEFAIMRKSLAIFAVLAFLFVPVSAQQTAATWIYGAIGNKGTWFTLGPTLKLTGTQLDVASPMTTPLPKEIKLTYNAVTGAWTGIPTSAKYVEIFDNGIRYWSGTDYTIDVAMSVKSLNGSIDPTHDVRAKYIE